MKRAQACTWPKPNISLTFFILNSKYWNTHRSYILYVFNHNETAILIWLQNENINHAQSNFYYGTVEQILEMHRLLGLQNQIVILIY